MSQVSATSQPRARVVSSAQSSSLGEGEGAGTPQASGRMAGDRLTLGRSGCECRPATCLTPKQEVGTALTMIGGAAALTTAFFAWVGVISPVLPLLALGVAVAGFAMVLGRNSAGREGRLEVK